MQELIKLSVIFGPFLFIIGLWMLIFSKRIKKFIASFKSIEPMAFIGGMLNTLIGLAIIATYNVWMWDISIFVTLLGWFFFVRGVILLFFPKFMFALSMASLGSLQFWGIIFLIWGLIISKIGFYHA
jgi:hypothetical protein